MEVDSISALLSAATPLVAIGVTVWVATRASRSQKRFDRETDLMVKVREECANYVALTLDLGRDAKKLTDSKARIDFFLSEPYAKVRYSYQYIMMFCTDANIRDAVRKFSDLDDKRFEVVTKAIAENDALTSKTSAFHSKYKEADKSFQANREVFYDEIRTRFEYHTKV